MDRRHFGWQNLGMHQNPDSAVCIVGALLFRRGLPVLREEARRLVRTQTAQHAATEVAPPP